MQIVLVIPSLAEKSCIITSSVPKLMQMCSGNGMRNPKVHSVLKTPPALHRVNDLKKRCLHAQQGRKVKKEGMLSSLRIEMGKTLVGKLKYYKITR